jgi:hypothetical protein
VALRQAGIGAQILNGPQVRAHPPLDGLHFANRRNIG